MGMYCSVRRASREEVARLLDAPEQVTGFLFGEDAVTPPPSGGFLSRLFGGRMRAPTPYTPATPAVVLTALAIACTAPPHIEPASEAPRRPATADSACRRVAAELERYYADLSARDWGAFADHFWTGATLTTVWQPPGAPARRVVVTTVPDFVAQAPQGPGSKPIFEERMTGVAVRLTGNLAQAWAHYTVRFGDPGSVATWHGVDAFTLVEHDGRWRIASLAYTDVPAAPAGGRATGPPARCE